LKTRVCLFIIIVANAVGNLLLAYGMREVGSIATYSPAELIGSGLSAMTNPWVLAGVLLLLVFFTAHAIVLSWADLSYVLLVTAIGYVLVAVLSRQFLGETISPLRWAGTIVITAGVMFVGSTPVSTVAVAAAGAKAPSTQP
jgi:drug/metabolite transporter (DMT)-like permease